MVQERRLIGETPGLRIELVRFAPSPSQWSPVYRAPARRLVLPGTGAVRVRSAAVEVLADSLTAFRVEAGCDYQLHPESDGERTSFVLSEVATRESGATAQAWLLSPLQLYRLRVARRQIEQGARVPLALPPGAAPLPPGAPAVLRARRFLMAQAGRDAPLAQVAEASFCSPFHLARLFRCHTGLSLHTYRTRLRLAQALQRLEAGECDLAGLAHDLGFSSQSHFGAVFRREVGVAPGQARAALSIS
jgi:AraC-like DNA-binding protein